MGKKKGGGGGGKNSIMNGRALFQFNPDLFMDDLEDANETSAASKTNDNAPIAGKDEEEKVADDDDGQIKDAQYDESLFQGENAEEEDVDFD